jgi:ketosteroid isomerase-like protein/quinol monooxygenase YgiN
MHDLEALFPIPGHLELVRKVIKADAERDAPLFASLFSERGVFQIGGNPPMVGPAQIIEGVNGFFAMLGGGIEHTFDAAWGRADELVWRATVTWTLRDGRKVSTPYVNVIRLRDGAVVEYRVHADLRALAPPPAPMELRLEPQPYIVAVVIDIEADRCDEMVQAIDRFAKQTVNHQRGFIASSLHTSVDRKRIINYTQWESEELFHGFMGNAMVQHAPALFAQFPPDIRGYRMVRQNLRGQTA